MIELPLVFISGLLGSSHCVGMCGPFALTIGSTSPSLFNNLRRQATFSLGRIFTYVSFGAIAGFGGLRLSHVVPTIINLPAVLALVAGGLLVYQGLVSAGVIGRKSVAAGVGPCVSGLFFSSFLGQPGKRSLFLAGMFTGMLPCGLVYALLALAASSASMPVGAATMALFGLGTVPVMILTGLGGSVLTLTARQRMLRIAAWCVVVAGFVSIARGAGFINVSPTSLDVRCLMCPSSPEPSP